MKSTTMGTKILGAAVLAALASLLACGTAKNDAASAAAGPTATPVKTVQVVRQKISERLTFTGTLEAGRKINITPETAGKVAKILVEEGQAVGKGQLLAELDTESLKLQVRQAEAGVAAAEANFATAAKNKERMDRLQKEKAVSDQQAEQVKLGHDAARAQLEQAQAGLNLARHYLDVAEMRAPWSGVVASRNVQEGDVINPMMGGFAPAGGVLTLMDYSLIKIVLDVGPGDISRIRRGQIAAIRPSDEAGREFPGTVTLVTATADALAKKFKVEVTVPNAGGALRPGTFGTVILDVATRDDALVVPQSAVLDNKYVFLAEGGKARRREVTLGLQSAALVEITAGLKVGDVVIVQGNYGLADGTAIDLR